VRFSDEELKHQELFRRIEELVAEKMPAGYRFAFDPNAVAEAVLSKSTWAVLALTLHIELFTLMHYLQSIEPDEQLASARPSSSGSCLRTVEPSLLGYFLAVTIVRHWSAPY